MTSVVITGVGLVTGLGTGAGDTWEALLEGRSAVGPLTSFDPSSLRTRIGAEIAELDTRPHLKDRRSLRNMTRNDQLAVVACDLAASDAGLTVTHEDSERAGLFLASHKEISDPSKVLDAVLAARNPDGSVDIARMGSVGAQLFYPLFYVEGLQAAALFYVSKEHGLRGANTYFAGSSDAGLNAIGRGYRAIRRGEADVVFAGGFDDATSWWNASRLDDFGILTESNALGTGACRPYDRDRDGSVLGEGAAFVVMENADSAAARGAAGYAEVSGFGSRFDPEGLITASPGGTAMAGAMAAALEEGRVAPGDVGYVATEGTATVADDRSEAAAIRHVFGGDAEVAASSVKPALGHLVAGAGAMNVAVAALAVRHGAVPPVLNLTDLDPECDGVDWVTGSQGRQTELNHAMAVARGMEGQNNALLLSACTSGALG